MATKKFEEFVREYDFSKVDLLPSFMKRRLDALKKLQLEHVELLHQYHKEIQEVELKYEKLYKPLYDKRFEIISGKHEPTEEERQLPPYLEDDSEDQENTREEPAFTASEEKTLESEVKGIPGFWLGCLSSSYNFNDSIEPHDRNILKHLQDLRLSYGSADEFLTYTLEFVFDENPHFTNKVLTKTYFLKLKPDEKDPFSYEGFEVVKSEGCTIDWKPGMNVTVKSVNVKQKNKHDGSIRHKKKDIDRDSFFLFFKPPTPPSDDGENDEMQAVMAVDFELGEIIRQNIIPRAALLYSGYIVDEDDSDDSELDDDEDESSEGDYGSDIEDSDNSDDSLAENGKDK